MTLGQALLSLASSPRLGLGQMARVTGLPLISRKLYIIWLVGVCDRMNKDLCYARWQVDVLTLLRRRLMFPFLDRKALVVPLLGEI